MRGLAVCTVPRGPPAPDFSLHMLQRSEQRLLEMVRRIGFGSLGNIPVRDGELILGGPLHTRSRLRLGKPDGASACSRGSAGDFKLKRQHRDLLSQVRAIRKGVITIEIQDGLPINLIIDEVVNF